MTDTIPPIPRLHPALFPPYVLTDQDRQRWQLCHALATRLSEFCDPGGRADGAFVFTYTRKLYSSDIPLGAPGDPPSLDFPGLT